MMGSSRDAADLPNALRRSSLDSRPSKDMTELLPTKRISVAYQVLSISDVNDNQNRFSVDFIVYYSWYDETLVQHEGDIDWNKVWQPHPKFFDNDLENTTIFSHLTLDEGGRVTLTERYRGTFYERLHLADFPFDRQNLTVNIGSKLPATELRFVEDDSRKSGVKEEFRMAEWHLLPPKSICTTVRSVASDNVYPLLKLCFRVRRRSGYYVYNTAVTISMMVIMSWSSFFVQSKELGDRMDITLTLVLTTVAWKYVVADKLPKISYLTLFDWYVMAAFLFIAATGVENVVVTLIDQDDAGTIDLYAGIAMCALWFIWHIVFSLWVWRARVRAHEVHFADFVIGEELDMVCLDGGLNETLGKKT